MRRKRGLKKQSEIKQKKKEQRLLQYALQQNILSPTKAREEEKSGDIDDLMDDGEFDDVFDTLHQEQSEMMYQAESVEFLSKYRRLLIANNVDVEVFNSLPANLKMKVVQDLNRSRFDWRPQSYESVWICL